MENGKWYTNALLILLVTLLSPFILIAVGLYVIFEEPKEKIRKHAVLQAV